MAVPRTIKQFLSMVTMSVVTNSLRSIYFWLYKVFQCILYVFQKEARKVISYQTVRYEMAALSPLTSHRLRLGLSEYYYFTNDYEIDVIDMVRRKTLVLDLDETLIHSQHDGLPRNVVKPGTPPDFTLRVTIDIHPVRFYVHKRPHVDYFLNIISQWFDLVVFTASMEIYGDAVADNLDQGKGIFKARYFRQDCTFDSGGFTKDLSIINPDLSSVFILDNSPQAYKHFSGKEWMNSAIVREHSTHFPRRVMFRSLRT